ncbi:MAG: AbrB family transcriptional regulator [Rhodocyclaceae bacterium]
MNAAHTAGALAIGLGGGALASLAHVPLPWMVGPMLAMACARLAHLPVSPPRGGRQAGQLAIGVALGLYFTPPVGRELIADGPWMILAGAAAIAIGDAAARVLARLSGIDRATAFFSSVPGGASEMAVLAERFGASVPHVAIAHALRILLVVLIVPGTLTALGATGDDGYAGSPGGPSLSGLAALAGLAAFGGWSLRRTGIPNAWMLGPLAVTIALTLAEIHLSSAPRWFTGLGQMLIGISLGSRFDPDFLRAAPRYGLALLASVALGLSLSALAGLGIAWLARLRPAALVLAAAPGGIAEMCITAQVLKLGVPLVTAFHVTRFVMVITLTGPLYRLSLRRPR